MIQSYHSKLSELYELYSNTLKPLPAEVESTLQELPIVLLNEIRMFNDHISRCYRSGITEDFINDNIKKARSHLKRAIFDCFKHLNVYYHDLTLAFEHDCRNIDLTTISNGDFYINYKKISQEAIKAVREAKKLETTNQEKAFNTYQDAYNKYVKLDDILSLNLTNINWARKRFIVKRILKIIVWFATAILSGIASSCFGRITNIVTSLFSR